MASSPRSSSLSSLPSLLQPIPLLLLGGLLLVAGCDSSVDLQQDDADPTTRTVPTDSSGLALAPMPTGSELLTPGAPAPKNNADASAYGCYLASRPYSDEVAFHSRYLHFPEEIVGAAGGQTRDIAYRVWIVPDPPPTAGSSEMEITEGQIPEPSTGVRFARCIIPDIDAAEALAREQVIKHGEAEAIAQSVGAEQAQAEQAQAEGGKQTPGKSSGTTCVFQEARTCILNTCWVEYHVECDSYGPGGGGSPPAGYYPDPDEPGPDDPGGGPGAPPGEGGSGSGDCTQKLPEPGSECEPADPCESDNPPAHCEDEDITPCSEVEFDNEIDGELIRALEEKGILEDLWDKSNLDQAQRDREERGGWITLEDGEYELVEFHEAYSGIEYKPFGIRGLRSGQRPAGTVAVVHTHPFEPGEVISDEEAIRAYIEHLNAEPEDYDIESLSSSGSIVYNSEPSDNDLAGAAALQMRSYFYDGDNIVAFGASVEYGEGNEDDELILTYEEMYERCGY